MICNSNKPGVMCPFMDKDGCTYNGGCRETVEQCVGCYNIHSFNGKTYCMAYVNPSVKWSVGNCNFATHLQAKKEIAKKVNPLKASKKKARKK